MTGTKRMLRVARVYEAMERVHRAEWMQRQASRALVEDAARANLGRLRESQNAARSFLGAGEVESWRLVEKEQHLLGWRSGALCKLLEQENISCERARESYNESRKRTGQIRSLCEDAAAEEKLHGDRLTQAEADERFLGRTMWKALAAGP